MKHLITSGLPDSPTGLSDKDYNLVAPLYRGINSVAQKASLQTNAVQYDPAELAKLDSLAGLKTERSNRLTVKAGENLNYGHLVYFTEVSGKYVAFKADNNATTGHKAVACVASVNGIATGAFGEVVFMSGLCTGISGAVAGQQYYLGSNGTVVNSYTPGTLEQKVGIGLGDAGMYLTTVDGMTSGPGGSNRIYFNVKDYGATGDGATNDAAAINSAVAAANPVGGILYFPPGLYVIHSPITVNNSTDTDPFAPKLSILGDGPTASKIFATSGAWDAIEIIGGTSGAGMHSHQQFSNISVYKDTGGAAISMANVAYAIFTNVYARGANYGLYATDLLSSNFYNCQFLFNAIAGVRMERSSAADGFQSGPNAINFHGCVLGNNNYIGGWFVDGGCINFHGGSIEGNGIAGAAAYPKAGLYCANLGLESGVGLNISGTYFENNKGTADVWLANTAHSTANSIAGATFNRVSSTNYTDNNIYAEGSGVTTTISLSGCGFKHLGSYAPAPSRPVLNKAAGHPVQFSWTGCYFSSTVDSPTFRNWTADRLAYVLVTAAGAIAGSSSYSNISSITKTATGRYTIYYADASLSVNPTVVVSAAGGVANVFASDSAYCTIDTTTLAGAAADKAFSVTVFG